MTFSQIKLTSILILFPLIGFCSCYDPNFTITEVLNHDTRNLHIFSCRILKTYLRNSDFESIAVVTGRYKGAPVDTVYLNTGGGSTAGGTKLIPNEEWLIFCPTKDSLHYFGATICHNLSVLLSDGNGNNCNRNSRHLGKIYSDLLLQYQKITESKYTGLKKFHTGNYLIAEGQFKNGKAHGEWIHYSKRDSYKDKKIKSTIGYQEGLLHGIYINYYEQAEQLVISERAKYDTDLLIWSEIPGYLKTEYEYLENGGRKISTTRFDTSGQIVGITHELQRDYRSPDYDRITYKEGYYLNKNGRDSSSYSPLGEGHYHRGARVGTWKFYDKKGQVVKEEQYKMPDREHDRFTLLEEDGTVKLSGQYQGDRRIGTWKYFWRGSLEMEQDYSTSGDLLAETRYDRNGGKITTQYRQKKKHGREITYSANQSNDYLQGYHIHKNAKTGLKIAEGSYWYGYRTGAWIHYQKDGSYSIAHYPTDTVQLMNNCIENMPINYQFYDKEGTLIPDNKY